jgi:hypothetical protein
MQNKDDDIMPNTGFKGQNFYEEKKKADELEAQHNQADNNKHKAREQEILKQQKETDD